jgi:hypothetical protein
MILHPGIIALIIGSAITLLMLLYATIIGTIIFFRWDYDSSSASQLLLERRTYLISTLVNYGLGFQVLSLILFIFTLDDIHQLFVGAMCATGSLNANPVGWYALLSKITIFFLAGFWIALNNIDQRAEEYPLVKLKYLLLALLLPCLAIDFYLQLSYFLGLDPEIITSCCGSLFSSAGESTLSSLSALPVFPTMIAFYGFSVFFAGGLCLNLYWAFGPLRALLTLTAVFYFVLAIVSIISFVSTYIYEMPMHHCPFDIVQREYNFIGYPLYITLLIGIYFGMLPGLFHPLKKIPGLKESISVVEKKWLQWSLGSVTLFVALVTYVVRFSKLTYFQ